jgi:hypothetical protein
MFAKTSFKIGRTLRRSVRSFRDFRSCECGVVESTLVLIPTLGLFLAILQIALIGISHGAEANQTQGVLARGSLYQANATSGVSAATSYPLVGGGVIRYLDRSTLMPSISPFSLGNNLIVSKTVAIDENQ